MKRTRCLGLLLALVLALAPGAAARAQEPPAADRIRDALVEVGFENVTVVDLGRHTAVWFENRIFRYDLRALGVAATLAAREADPQALLELIPLQYQVPILTLSAPVASWNAFLAGDLPVDTFRGQIRVMPASRRLPGAPGRDGQPRANPSTFRTDLAVRPVFSYEIGLFNENFRTSIYASPEVTVSPFAGFVFRGNLDILIQDEIFPCKDGVPQELISGDCPAPVAPSRATLSWGGWLPRAWLGAASIGLFSDERYGIAAEASRLFLDGMLEARVGGDLTGELEFLYDRVEYSNISVWSAAVTTVIRPPGVDLEATVKAGRFQEGAGALKIDVARRFREVEVGFFAAWNEFFDSQKASDNLVGARIRLPLPVRRWSRPARFRPVTVPDFSIDYEEEARNVAATASFYDDVDRLRRRLYPPYVLNNLGDLRKVEPQELER